MRAEWIEHVMYIYLRCTWIYLEYWNWNHRSNVNDMELRFINFEKFNLNKKQQQKHQLWHFEWEKLANSCISVRCQM